MENTASNHTVSGAFIFSLSFIRSKREQQLKNKEAVSGNEQFADGYRTICTVNKQNSADSHLHGWLNCISNMIQVIQVLFMRCWTGIYVNWFLSPKVSNAIVVKCQKFIIKYNSSFSLQMFIDLLIFHKMFHIVNGKLWILWKKIIHNLNWNRSMEVIKKIGRKSRNLN